MTPGRGWESPEERKARLLEVLRCKPNDATCQACLSRLDEYVAAQLAGEDYVVRYPDVAMHLDACPDCADVYARLYELELAEAAGRLPQPDRLPDPDLSFLLPGATGPLSPAAFRVRQRATALAERLRTALRRVGDRITLQFSPELLSLLRPSPAVAPTRAPADAERYGEVLLALEPDETLRPDLPVTLIAYRDAHCPETCLVEVGIQPPGRGGPDLEGIGVSLTVSGVQHRATTDAWGWAAFAGIPVERLASAIVEFVL